MTEISTMLLIFLIEGLAAAVIIIVIWSVLAYRRKKRDRAAVSRLVDQIKHQSKTRMEITSSFLEEKYRFEGSGLKKAVAAIDKAEKKFMQKLINIYLKRDSHGLTVMDASMAELIEVYKELTPVMPEQPALEPAEPKDTEEVRLLRLSNASLVEELNASRQSMADMLEEFGNMFGGGKKHELERNEVLDKLNKYKSEHESSERFADASELEVQLDEPVTEAEKDVDKVEKKETDKAEKKETDKAEKMETGNPEEQDKPAVSSSKKEDAEGEDQVKPAQKPEPQNNRAAVESKKTPAASKQQPVDEELIEFDDIDVVNQDEIDDLLNSFDLSDDVKK